MTRQESESDRRSVMYSGQENLGRYRALAEVAERSFSDEENLTIDEFAVVLKKTDQIADWRRQWRDRQLRRKLSAAANSGEDPNEVIPKPIQSQDQQNHSHCTERPGDAAGEDQRKASGRAWDEGSCRVLVRGFDWDTNEEQLARHMGTVGSVRRVKFCDTGSANVIYHRPDEATAAMNILDKSRIEGNARYIDVLPGGDLAEEKKLKGTEIAVREARELRGRRPMPSSSRALPPRIEGMDRDCNTIRCRNVSKRAGALPFVVPLASSARFQSLQCPRCDWVADSHGSLQAHERTEHSKAYRCGSCSQSFSNVEAVRRHSRSTRHQIDDVYANSDEAVVAISGDQCNEMLFQPAAL